MPKYIYKHRRGTTTQWADHSTLIPHEGEIVIELDEVNGLHKLKIGDGVHTYADLAYLMAGDEIVTQVLAETKPRIVTVELPLNWVQGDDNKYSQVLTLGGITEHSRLDLQPTADMLAEFKRLGLVFVTENNGGTITVYSVGNMPPKSYTMQATIIETECDGQDIPVVGIPVGSPAAQSDWNQTNENDISFIKNKPTLGTLAAKDEVAKTDLASDIQASLGKADSALQTYTETDPTVPAWAKADKKPTYTADEVGAATPADIAAALEESKSYTDNELATFDFIKVADELPSTGLPNKIYLVPKSDAQTQDLFDEYIWVNKGTEESPEYVWEWITTKQLEVDLTGYVERVDGKGLSTEDFTTDEKNKLKNIAENANNYTLPEAGSALGGVKTGGNVTINAGIITVNDDEHNHVIDNVDGLQDALDEKSIKTTSVEDSTSAYIKDVPSESAPYAEVLEIGGATRKCSNLLALPYTFRAITINGTQINANNDGSFTAQGACTANGTCVVNDYLLTAGTYAISNNSANVGVQVWEYNDATFGAELVPTFYNGTRGFTLTSDTTVRVRLYCGAGTTANGTFNVWINKDTALPYEPYFDGLRSAKVESVESVGGNLLDETIFTKMVNCVELNTEYVFSGGVYSANTGIVYKPNTQYTLAYVGKNDSGATRFVFRYTDGTQSDFYFRNDDYKEFVFVSDANKTVYDLYTYHGDSGYLYIKKGTAMIYEGSVAKPYTPFVRHTLPIPEAVQELDGYGEGINETYHNFIRFDGEKRIYTQQVKRRVFDGTENWRLRSASNVESNYVSLNLGAYGTVITGYGKCSHYDRYNLAFTNTGIGFNVLNSNGYDAAMVTVRPWNGIASADEWKTYLAEQYAAGTPVTVVYALAEAEVTDITDLVSADNLLPVEGGGTVTMVNEYGYDVPSVVEFYDGNNDVIGSNAFVGDLQGTAARALSDSEGNEIAKTYAKQIDIETALDGKASVDHGHSYNDLSDKPTIPAAYTHPTSHPASMITGLATVATSGKYSDLSDKPTIPTIPSSLPANGGNADTVDNKHASDFATATHTHNYAGSSSAGGAANSANALNAIKIASGSDLNSFTTCGFYYVSSNADAASITNSPTSKAFFMIVGKHAGTYQEVVSYLPGNPARYMRNKNNNSWGDWFEVITSNTLADSLPAAGSSLGAVKTGGDVSIADGVITVNDDSHNHTIANVDGLQTALNGKAPAYTYGTQDLVAGESTLATGTLYFVYED